MKPQHKAAVSVTMKYGFILLTAAVLGQLVLSDDLKPLELKPVAMSQLKCKVTAIRPEGAQFFMTLGLPPQVGDTTTLNLDVEKIGRINFDSGNTLGSGASNRNPLKRVEDFMTNTRIFQGSFHSTLGIGRYDGNLVASLLENGLVSVGVDIVNTPLGGRVVLNSLDMECSL